MGQERCQYGEYRQQYQGGDGHMVADHSFPAGVEEYHGRKMFQTKSRLMWIASPDEAPGEESDEAPKLENANQRFAFSLRFFTRGLIRGFIRGAFLALTTSAMADNAS